MIDFKKIIEEEERAAGYSDPSDREAALILNNKKRRRAVTYIIGAVVVGLIFSGRVIMSSQDTTDWLRANGFLNRLIHLVPSADRELPAEQRDRINILLLGMGGEGHDGAYLTDTLMLLSLQPSTKQVAMISFPRDLVAPVSNWRKINSINAFAEQRNPGSGGGATAAAFSELLDMPIDYYVRIDFNGFVKIIDQLGGIEIDVENTLDDYSYPASGQENNPNYYARFERLYIPKGLQTMDGTLALKYARSRHGLGGEGSDFARARRQQLVLDAMKTKLLSGRTLLNPVTVARLANELNKNISTNLQAWEMLRLWDLFHDVDRGEIITKVLSDAPDNLLVAGKGEDGAYILSPRSGNFNQIRSLVRDIFSSNIPGSLPAKPKMVEDGASVMILNGTWVTGLAGKTADSLKARGFRISHTANAPLRDYKKSVVYDLSNSTKKSSLDILRQATGASISIDSPAWLVDYLSAETAPDFLLVVGTDLNR